MDLNVSAFRIVQELTTENKRPKRSDAAKIAGRVGGKARASKLTPERRKEISANANAARWKDRPSGE